MGIIVNCWGVYDTWNPDCTCQKVSRECLRASVNVLRIVFVPVVTCVGEG